MDRQQIVGALLATLSLSCILPAALAQTGTGVYTTYHFYNPAQVGYALDNLYCATWKASESYEWRSKYPWTAFCGSAGGPMRKELCGKCLKVTNPSTGQSVVVRILDKCSNGGLDLDWTPFQAIDSNGQGYNAGHMTTTYTFVAC